MNKIKFLKDLLRLCTHIDLDHKPLYLCTRSLPLSHLSLIKWVLTVMGGGWCKYGLNNTIYFVVLLKQKIIDISLL